MICVHAYCNIYQRAMKGYVALERRMACSYKLKLLRDATSEEITARDDVCPICFLVIDVSKWHNICT